MRDGRAGLALLGAFGGDGDGFDVATDSDSLGDFAEIAIYPVSVEVDVDSCGAVFLLSGGRDVAAARRVDPGPGSDHHFRGNGCVPGATDVVGFGRYSRFAGSHRE